MPALKSIHLIFAATLMVGPISGCFSIPAEFQEGMRPDELEKIQSMTALEYKKKVQENRGHTIIKRRGGIGSPKVDDAYSCLPPGFLAPYKLDFLAAAANPNYDPKWGDQPGNEKFLPILARQGTVLYAMVVGSTIEREQTAPDRSRLTESLEEVLVTMDIGSLISAEELDHYRLTLWPQPNRSAAVYAVPVDEQGEIIRDENAFIFSLYKMQGMDIKQAMRIAWED